MTVVRIRGTNNFGSNTSISVTQSVSDADDLLILTCFLNQNGSGNLVINDPAGWTLLDDVDIASAIHMRRWWKKTAGGSVSVTATGWGVSRVCGLFLAEYFGQNLTTPFAAVGASANGTGTVATSAAMTPDATDDLVVSIGNNGGTTIQSNTPAAWTQRQIQQQGASTNNGMDFAVYDRMDPGAVATSLAVDLLQAGVPTSRPWAALIAQIDDRGASPPATDFTMGDSSLWSQRFFGFDVFQDAGAPTARPGRGLLGVGA